MAINIPKEHPHYPEVQQLNEALKTTRKHMDSLYRRRDVLLGWRVNEASPKLAAPLRFAGQVPPPPRSPQVSAVLAGAAGSGPSTTPNAPSAPQRRATDHPPGPGTSVASQLLALLSAAPGVDWTTKELTQKLGLPPKLKNTVVSALEALVKAGAAKTHGRGRWILAAATAADVLDARA
jgi:hypothetical protein